MADTSDRDAARSRAQTHFSASDQRDSLVKQMIESERAATAAKTAKLRALRLAKEEADRAAAANAPKPETAQKTRARKAPAKKS
ncbi:MAG TPA: hypothetical protein VLV55_13375 [Rhizomicrobium sp.]|nr:hypothetical protein [Rhizomicrobium sp.]